MLHISTQKLIEKLLERTQKGTIDWKEREPDGVILETEGYTVELTKGPASVKLSQSGGRLLEDVSEENLKNAMDSSGRNYADIVTELTTEADRFAKGTEQAIASILDAVEASSKPVLKSGPAFPGQPKDVPNSPSKIDSNEVETSTSDEPVEEKTNQSDTDPYTEAGMSAAVGKMVAEINGEPAGDELDALTPKEGEEETAPPEEVAKEESPPEVKKKTEDTPPNHSNTESNNIAEPNDVSSSQDIGISEDVTTAEDEIKNAEQNADLSIDDIPLPEELATDIIADTPESVETDVLLASPPPPPPPPLEIDITEPLNEEAVEDSNVTPPPALESEEAKKPADEGVPDIDALEIPANEPKDAVEEKELQDKPVHKPERDEVSTLETAPTADEPKKESEEAPKPIGFSFHNKVTATGMTLAGNIGTLVPGLPDDIRQRADDHERKVKLRNEKIEAEKRAEEARKTAEEAEKNRDADIGFKSWS